MSPDYAYATKQSSLMFPVADVNTVRV